MNDSSNEPGEPEITLEALLLDAATVLEKQEGLKALASAVRMALAERGVIPGGETWVADVVAVISAADTVIAQAGETPHHVDLGPLADALDVTRNWGLTPEHRIGNFLRHTVIRLENLRALVLSQLENNEPAAIEAPVLETLDDLLAGFGFPRDGVG